jgi:tight adherence protein C
MPLAGLIIGLALVGFAVVMLVRAIAAPGGRESSLYQIGSYGYESESTASHERSFAEVAGSLGDLFARRRGTGREENLRQRMIAAGWYHRSPRVFVGYQVLAALALPLIWLLVWAVSGFPVAIMILGLPLAALVGWRFPTIVLDRAIKERFRQIDRALPGFIDLLVVAVEAGLGFVPALRLTTTELEGPLAAELRLTLQEQTMGLSMAEALEALLRRVDTPGTRAFVRAVVQGETLGVSIGTILRNLADQLRKKRKASAEEQAQKAPVKMLFPLVFLVFPAMFVVILLPAVITIANALGD